MSKDFRYFEQARQLSDELAEIKPEPKTAQETTSEETAFSEGGLRRIAMGETALAGMPKVAGREAVESLQRMEIARQGLHELVEKKASVLDDFIEAAGQLASDGNT